MARKSTRFMLELIGQALAAAAAVLPFLILDHHRSFEFWKCLACYGAYLTGFATFYWGMAPRSRR
jgi:drug/metabolite transporter (DMT)-like permease